MTKKIIIPYFPKELRYLTPICGGVGIWLMIIHYPVWGTLLLFFGAIILSTHYVTEINLNAKSYRDYLSLLGLKLNVEENRFKTLDRIVITKGTYAQTINTRAQSRQMDWTDYTGTLLMDHSSLELVTRTDKQELIKVLKCFSEFLQVDVEDQTTGQHYYVDMKK